MSEALDTLLEKAVEAVRRDLNHIFTAVSVKKLDATASRDLIAYVKLLSDIKDKLEESNALPLETDEELKALAKELLKN